MFLTSDFHGGSRLILDPMIDRTGGAMDSDLFFFLGDNVEDGNYNNIRFYVTFGFLDDITRRWGSFKPTIFMRGNHDLTGADNYRYGDYFPSPEKTTYQAIRQGSTLFICLDSMWHAREKVQDEQVTKYLQEQLAWIDELKKTDLWKTAKFRVVMSHVAPLFSSEGVFMNGLLCEYFNKTSPEDRIHIYLAGHEHCYYRINPGTREARINADVVNGKNYPPAYIGRTPEDKTAPYTLVVLNIAEGMTLDVSDEKLVFKSYRWSVPEGGFCDAFEVYPDGTVKDLLPETGVYPIPVRK